MSEYGFIVDHTVLCLVILETAILAFDGSKMKSSRAIFSDACSEQGGNSATAPLWWRFRSSQGCSARWKTCSGQGEEGLPVLGVKLCKVKDTA